MVILLLFSFQMNDSICETESATDKNVQKFIAEIILFYFTSRITTKYNGDNKHEQIHK